MKIPKLILLFSLYSGAAIAGDLTAYMGQYARYRQGDPKKEQALIANHKPKKLIKALSPFYGDTLQHVRQKAYYLTYKNGLLAKDPSPSIHKLLDGCKDKNGGITGLNIRYLEQFNKKHFDKEALAQIESLLTRRRMPHYKDMILLAGFAGAGKELFRQKMLDPELPQDIQWHMALALARMGEKDQAAYCMGQIKKQPVNNQAVATLLPLAMYIRQKESIGYVVEILNQDKKQCRSLNPDNPDKIKCGYRAMELLAPVVDDFPLQLDATGSIDTDDYPKALETARAWLAENPAYTLRDDIY